MERSALMTTGILGILKSGGAYLPLDPGYPESRLSYMLDDANVGVILTTSELVGRIPDTRATVICLDKCADIESESIENPANINSVSDLAYIIYTSGSTGKPKGTLIPHKAVNRLVFNTNYISLSSADRIGHISNVSFDAATFELWGSLLHGGCLVVIDKDLVLSPKDLIAELRKQKVTAMFLTTALFNLIARDDPSGFKTLKTLMVGGEAVDPTVFRLVLENDPPERLLDVYGPTESTTFATWNHVDSAPQDAHSIAIGRPLANTTIYILDRHLNPVPVGVPGEILIGGDGLAHGYLNRPELTAERFVNVPVSKIGGVRDSLAVGDVRLYRTGDIARFLPDGNIEYLGRKDDQIKLRGFRIELGEIENVLNSHPSVKEAVVIVRVKDGDKRLAAYYVGAGDAAPTAGELRDFLGERLPDYMIPGIFFEVKELSLNGNGKLDRKNLPSLDEMPTGEQSAREAAHDELELKLSWIWQKVLGLGSVGIHDNFFDLGGHSLAAVRVFSEIENTLGCRLPLATLFKAPTIAQLADLLRGSEWRSTWGALVPLKPAGTKPPFFCVHAVGGNVLEYNELAKHLDADQPFYALQALGLDGKRAPLTDIDTMAHEYVKEIRQVQPAGPYYLGGRSFGGTVAYEMARLLVEQGEEVALLAIFDSYPKGWLKLCSAEEADRYRREFRDLRIKKHLENFRRLGLTGKVRYFLHKAKYKTRKYKNRLWRLTQSLGLVGKQSVTTTIRNIEELNYMAVKAYVPKIYPGRLTFYCAAEEVCPEENLIGWRRLAEGGVDVVEVPGDHQTMIKQPHVGQLAKALEDSIAEAIEKV
jgi:amino acid adenylation domain-containing protein